MASANLRLHLVLHALQGVVDGLRMPAEGVGDVLVGMAGGVEPEDLRLERRQHADTTISAGSQISLAARMSESSRSPSSSIEVERENEM